MEGQDKQSYIKSFNQGYRLAKEVPDFSLKKVPEALKNQPRMKGIMDGMSQWNKEKYLAKTRSQTPKKSPPNKGKRMDR